MTSLPYLPVGQKAEIVHLETNNRNLISFLEMGLRVNQTVKILGRLPLGGNLIVLSEYGKYILRKKDALMIKIRQTKA